MQNDCKHSNTTVLHLYIYTTSGYPWWKESVIGFQGQTLSRLPLYILPVACTNHVVLNYLSSMWCAIFGVLLMFVLNLLCIMYLSVSESLFLSDIEPFFYVLATYIDLEVLTTCLQLVHLKQGLDTFVCFADFKKAFDSISKNTYGRR